jgi:hypothetical protein
MHSTKSQALQTGLAQTSIGRGCHTYPDVMNTDWQQRIGKGWSKEGTVSNNFLSLARFAKMPRLVDCAFAAGNLATWQDVCS